MAMLEELLGQMLGGNTGANSQSPVQGMIGALFQGGPGGNAGGGGGLSGLVSQFESAGLGHVVQSWIGNGPNTPVSPDQLQRVLGPDQVNGMAQSSNMEPGALLTELSQLLPGMVNRMTPQGQLAGAGQSQVANPFGGQPGAATGNTTGGDDPWSGPGQSS